MSQVEKLNKQLAALDIEYDQVLPAQRNAAQATAKLAEIEYNRTKALLDRKAVPQAQFDKINASLERAKADLQQASANIEAKEAEMDSLRADIAQAKEAVKDAQF